MKTSIGIEIEVNRISDKLNAAIDKTLWRVDGEHCGRELRSIPCAGPMQIRRLMKSIKKMEKSSKKIEFDNAGTHIHIDFIPPPNKKNPRNEDELVKIDTKEPVKWMCEYCDVLHEEPADSPFGQRFYWRDKQENNWRTPGEYIQAWRPKKPDCKRVYIANTTHRNILSSVKKFCLIGKRFAHVFFAIQKPERRFNKYCHTIEFWDEKALMKANSIKALVDDPRLANTYRRLMFNPMAFKKFGTVEVRMIAASFNSEDIWAQTFMFGKLAKLAKSDTDIPKSTGIIAADFINLMNAAKIHGRIRKRLSNMIVERKVLNASKVPTRCFCCQIITGADNHLEYGLSRPICLTCHQSYTWCHVCGQRNVRDVVHMKGKKVDNKGHGGRHHCGYCGGHKNISKFEKTHDGIYMMGKFVKGIDKDGKPIRNNV